jgi:hypothetical protein
MFCSLLLWFLLGTIPLFRIKSGGQEQKVKKNHKTVETIEKGKYHILHDVVLPEQKET